MPTAVAANDACFGPTPRQVWNAIANKLIDQVVLSSERRELLREAAFSSRRQMCGASPSLPRRIAVAT